MEVKDLIKTQRIKHGYTMVELAAKVGVSPATISRWESGYIASMKQTVIAKLADALHISPADLVPGAPVTNVTMPLSQQEQDHIKKYRALDERGKRNVDAILDMEYGNVEDSFIQDEKNLG